ncbi:MAG: plastocyanin/azurin family copper-binding protein [Thermoproteota archaeon]|nr:plastocyanin/azurin family copper-binding protein [Thermoproteota archaeon]
MNIPVIAGIAAGILLAGIILGPFSPGFFSAEAQNATTTGKVKKVTMIASEKEVQVAPDNALHPGGIKYTAMVFNGTIPGPVVSVDQGDTVDFTLINQGKLIHSMDFHAGDGDTQAVGANASATGSNIKPGESVHWRWVAKHAGAWFYHCGADGLNGVWEHIANGMYGGVVVHPPTERPAKEFYVVFGEIFSNNVNGLYTKANGTGSFDVGKFLAGNPDVIVTNGMGHKYVPSIGAFAKITLNPAAQVFKVKPGELTRWYIFAAGPNQGVSFHFISGQIGVHDGSVGDRPMTQVLNEETWWIPVGSGSVIEATFPDKGIYVGVDHAMNNVLKGGAFAVLAADNSTATDHPQGTWVPPKGSEMVSGPAVGTPPSAGTQAQANMTTQNQPNMTARNPANLTEGATIVTTPTTAGGTNATTAGGATNATGTSNSTGTGATSGTSGGAAAATSGTSVSIVSGASSMTNTAFKPNPATVHVGDTVTWTNDDTQPHTVTSGSNGTPDNKFNSSPNFNPLLAPGQTFQHKFTAAGQYPYFCALHPNMVGTVSVS